MFVCYAPRSGYFPFLPLSFGYPPFVTKSFYPEL